MNDMRAVLGIIRHEVLLQVKTKLFALSLINSIIVVLIWGYLAGLQAQPMTHLRVAVVEGMPEAGVLLQSPGLRAVSFADADEAAQAVRRGEVTAAVLSADAPGAVRILLDDSQGAAARAALSAITAALFRPRPVGPILPPDTLPAVFDVEEAWGLGMDQPTYLLKLLGAGLVAMVVLSNAFVFSGFTLISEKTSGTIFFLALAPLGRVLVIVGKVIGNTLLIALSATITVALAVGSFGALPTGSLWLLIVSAVVTGIGLMGLCYAVSAYVRDERTFRVVAGLPLMVPMMFLSGIMYPIAMFPPWLQQVASFLPLTWLVDISHAVFFKGGGLSTLWPPVLLLTGFAVLMVALGGIAVSRLMRVN
jgi:ABC-2 type transport system permease protein